MKIANINIKLFGYLFLLTGIFALLGGLYTWGDGSIFNQSELTNVLIPWADIILTAPLSIIVGFGLLQKKHWAKLLGLTLSGIYIFGSLLVFISLIWNHDYTLYLIVPASSGLLIGLGYIGFLFLDKLLLSEIT
jgi:hypothetical protein